MLRLVFYGNKNLETYRRLYDFQDLNIKFSYFNVENKDCFDDCLDILNFIKSSINSEKLYFIATDDTYVNIDNLIKVIGQLNINQSNINNVVVGGHLQQYYQSGLLISKQLLLKIFNDFTPAGCIKIWRESLENKNTDKNFNNLLSFLLNFYDYQQITHANFYYCDNLGCVKDGAVRCCCGDQTMLKNCKDIVCCSQMTKQSMINLNNELNSLDNIMIVNNYTLVTMLYHLPRYGEDFNKPIEFYLEKSLFVLSLPVNLVIFCDEPEVEHIKKIRLSNNLLKQTKIIVKPATDFKIFNLRDKIRENRKNNLYYNKSNRNTPNYAALVTCKFEMMVEAMEDNSFKTDFFGWIDLGSSHIVGNYRQQLINNLKIYREKASFCFLDYTQRQIVDDYRLYYAFGRSALAATFFTGHQKYLTSVMNRGIDKFISTVEQGFGHAEEQILLYCYYDKPDDYNLFYGYYYQLFNNYINITSNHKKVLEIVKNARCDGCYYLTVDAGLKLIQSFDLGLIDLDLLDLINLLDDIYIGYFYLGNYDQCCKILEKHLTYDQKYRKYKDCFKSKADHLINNADFLLNHIIKNKTLIKVNKNNDGYLDYRYDKNQEIVFIYSDKYSSKIQSLVV